MLTAERPITGSARRDRLVFVGFLVLLLGVAPRLVVYHHLQTMRVSVFLVSAEGDRIALDPPEIFRRPGVNLRATERRVREFAASEEARRMTPPGGQLEWRLEYSRDFSRSHVVSVDAGSD